jgi:hypothetical protein
MNENTGFNTYLSYIPLKHIKLTLIEYIDYLTLKFTYEVVSTPNGVITSLSPVFPLRGITVIEKIRTHHPITGKSIKNSLELDDLIEEII